MREVRSQATSNFGQVTSALLRGARRRRETRKDFLVVW
jgi:hypothetical protein